jgi:predicted lipoprotein with Yx(FWY)xxD motif
MKRNFTLLVTAFVLSVTAIVAAVIADTSPASARTSKGALVAIRKTKLGTILVDARGRSLYLFEKDKRRMSACYGACATYWPPLLSPAKPRAEKGVHAALLGVTKRKDGKRQVTYGGHPLYTFIADKKPGQTTGEGLNNFGAAWDVVAPNGRSIEPAGAPSGGGYGAGG